MSDIRDIKPIQVIKGFMARFIHTETMALEFWEVEKGAVLPHINIYTNR